MWIKPLYSWTLRNNDDGAPGYKSSSAGVIAGIDGDAAEGTRIGVALSWMNNSLRGRGWSVGQSAEMTAYGATLYGSQRLDDATALNWQIGGGVNDVEGKRHIAFGGLDRVARSNYRSPLLRGGLELDRLYRVDEATTLTPSLRMDYTWLSDPAYVEKGADALNLRVRSRVSDTLTVFTGLAASRNVGKGITLSARLGGGYDVKRSGQTMTASYVGGGEMFSTDGASTSRWLTRGGVDLSLTAVGGVEITASHSAELRSGYLSQRSPLDFARLRGVAERFGHTNGEIARKFLLVRALV